MDYLPDELLELVFLKLNKSDLLSAIAVCHRWKTLITQSTSIFGKIPLILDNFDDYQLGQDVRNLENLLNCNRKFSVLKIHHKHSLDFMEIIKKLGENIKKLEIFSCQFSSVSHLRIILRFLPNLHSISVYQVTVEKFDDCKYLNQIASIPTLSLPKLRVITLNECDSRILSLFLENDRIRISELRFNHSSEYGKNFSTFHEFLLQKSSLKVLEINNVSTSTGNFLSVDLTEFISFQLDSLEIKNCAIVEQNPKRNFLNFLKSQKKLKEIQIINSNVPDDVFVVLLTKLKSLKSVDLDMRNFEYFYDKYCYINESVQNLKIYGNFASENQPTFNNIIRRFPNCRKLELIKIENLSTYFGVISDKFMFSIFMNFKNLRELHIQGLAARLSDNNFANLDCLEIEQLRTLVIDNIRNDVKYNDWRNLIRNLRNIETLVINRAISGATSEIIDLFISNLKYLKHLELGKGIVNDSILLNIVKSKHNIKMLKLPKSDYERLKAKFDFAKAFNNLFLYLT